MESRNVNVRIPWATKIVIIIFAVAWLIPISIVMGNLYDSNTEIFNLVLLLLVESFFLWSLWYLSMTFSYYPDDKLIVKRLGESIFKIHELTGWAANESRQLKSISFYFNRRNKVTIPCIGEELSSLAQRIIDDNRERITQVALREIINHGSEHKTRYSTYTITKDYFERRQGNNHIRFEYNAFSQGNNKYFVGDSYIDLIYNNTRYTIGAGAFRKDIGLFYGMIELLPKKITVTPA